MSGRWTCSITAATPGDATACRRPGGSSPAELRVGERLEERHEIRLLGVAQAQRKHQGVLVGKHARQRAVELTLRGKALLATVEDVYVELERSWAAAIGASRVERLRGDLMRVLLERHGGQLPPVRPTW